MRAKKSWREKLADSKGLPKVSEICGNMTRRWGTGTMVIPAPLEVDEVMRTVPKGKLITINEIRAVLPDATVVLRIHSVAWKKDRSITVPCFGILVTQRFGPFTLRREFEDSLRPEPPK